MAERRRGRIASLAGPAMLLLAAVIWGAGFLAQQLGMDHVGPWTFGVVRNALAVAALLPVVALRRAKAGPPRKIAAGSVVCGTALFSASMAQQVGLQWTSAGMGGFLTSIYVLAVPLIGLGIGRKPPRGTWSAVAIAVAGLFMICVGPDASMRLGRGEALELACALLFAVQILCIDRFAADVDPVALSCGEFAVCFVEGLPFLALPSEAAKLSATAIAAAFPALAFAGIVSSGVAYTLQTVAQARTRPAVASLTMSLEAVFAAFFGWAVLHQTMSARQIAGCALLFCAVVSAQLLSLGDKKPAMAEQAAA